MNKLKFKILYLFLFVANIMSAQINIKGTVIDESKEPMPGVTVQVKGKNMGTVTDLDGNFKLKVPGKNSIIVVSFIGYQSKEIKVGNEKSFKIKLEEESLQLDEVVVSAGYTEIKRRDFTGSYGKVDMDEMMKSPVVNFDQALAGRVAGVQVSSNEGGPNAEYSIVIRGNNSLTQSNQPLYVIDGFPMESAEGIDPNDIANIDILKDASSTAIYGSRGANGVVIITTKKGMAGKPTVNYKGSFSVNKITNTYDLLDGYEFAKLQTEVQPEQTINNTYFRPLEDGTPRDLDWYSTCPYVDWQDEVFRTAFTHNHYFSITGGSNDTKYSSSFSYLTQEGVIDNSDYSRFQGRINLEHNITKKLKLNVIGNYTRGITNGTSPSATVSSSTSSLMYSVWGYRPVTYNDIDLRTAMIDPDVDSSNDYRFNPILSLREEYSRRYEDNLGVNESLEYQIMKGLKVKSTLGYKLNKILSEKFNNSRTRSGYEKSADHVNASAGFNESSSWLNENILTYEKRFKKSHYMNFLAGVTFQGQDSKAYSVKVINISDESLGMSALDLGTPSTASSSASEVKSMSYLAKANYNYKSKYYLTASFRADGSSKLSKNNRWGYFPSASIAWNFAREDFMKKVKWFNNGKLRFSWGMTGNNRVSDFASYSKVYSGRSSEYSFGDAFYPGYLLGSLGNENLKWETTTQINLGLDLGFFNDRIVFTFDSYIKNTDDLLLYADIPTTTGFSNVYKNIGKMRNSGLEFTLETVNVKTRDFMWTSNFNISFNQGKVVELNDNQRTLYGFAHFDNHYDTPNYVAQVGKPVGMMYGYIYEGTYKYDDFDKIGNKYVLKPTVPTNGDIRSNIQPGAPKYKDINGDGKIDDNDKTIIGNGHPIHIGGFTNTFSYKNFDLSVFFQWSYGNDIINANKYIFESGLKKNTNQFASYADRWSPENPESDIPAPMNRASMQGSHSSRVVEDGSYLRLKNIALSYNLPKNIISKWHIKSAKIFLSGENLLTFTSYSGLDPEVSVRNSALTPGLDFSAYPRAYNFSLGVNLSF